MKQFQNVGAYVLAGGRSARMGQDKALLELAGVPMVVRMARLAESQVASVAVVAPGERYAGLGLRVISDRWPGAGPLGGIATALRAAEAGATTTAGNGAAGWNLILGCDLPFLTPEWIAWLISRALASVAQAVVPESKRGLEPLAAMYQSRSAAALTTAIERGVRRVTEGLAEILYERVPASEWRDLDAHGMLFENVNTPEDYARAREYFEKHTEKPVEEKDRG